MKFFLRNILDIPQDLFCLLNSKQVEDYWHSNCHLAAGDKPQYEVLVLPDHADRQPVQPDEVAALLQEEVQLRRAGRQLVQLPLRSPLGQLVLRPGTVLGSPWSPTDIVHGGVQSEKTEKSVIIITMEVKKQVNFNTFLKMCKKVQFVQK